MGTTAADATGMATMIQAWKGLRPGLEALGATPEDLLEYEALCTQADHALAVLAGAGRLMGDVSQRMVAFTQRLQGLTTPRQA